MKVRWYIDGNHNPEDARETDAKVGADRDDVVRTIAENWWHKSGDYCQSFELVVLAPTRFVGRYPIEVESVPHFVVGGPS